MAKRICSISGCNRPAKTRGWCDPHYKRFLTTGDTRPADPIRSITSTEGECSVSWCDRPITARGLCVSHYRNGESWTPVRLADTDANTRLLHYSTVVGECREWTGSRIYSGYGMSYDNTSGALVLAHRLAYETWVGPIPDGMDIDHICKNRACIEPTHLRPLTPKENRAQGGLGREKSAEERAKISAGLKRYFAAQRAS